LATFQNQQYQQDKNANINTSDSIILRKILIDKCKKATSHIALKKGKIGKKIIYDLIEDLLSICEDNPASTTSRRTTTAATYFA